MSNKEKSREETRMKKEEEEEAEEEGEEGEAGEEKEKEEEHRFSNSLSKHIVWPACKEPVKPV